MRSLPINRHAQLKTVSGFTLLEIVVTLVLLGLAAAMVAPAFQRNTSRDSDVGAIVASAREAAVRRAQTLVLHVDDRGAWRLTPVRDTASISSGVLPQSRKPLTVRISPLGACFHEEPSIAPKWDAISCVPARGKGR